jgi:hypothetical protein
MRTHAMLTDGSSPLERTLATALAAIQEEVR